MTHSVHLCCILCHILLIPGVDLVKENIGKIKFSLYRSQRQIGNVEV
jgi:hypothetical protein